MLPISEAMIAKRFKANSKLIINWILFDVYKIAANFPLEVSVYGFIYTEKGAITNNKSTQNAIERIQITDRFQSKSVRDDLQGLKLKCGLVVCILSLKKNELILVAESISLWFDLKLTFPKRFTYLEDPTVEAIDIFSKGTNTVTANMRENLNMTCDILQVDNYGWNINGTFNGMMGLFQKNKIEILAHAAMMRVDRLKHVEFTAEVFVVE